MTRTSVFYRRRTVRAVVAVLAAALTSASVAIPMLRSGPTADAGVTQSPGLSSGQVLSGVVIRGGTSAANAFASFRHEAVTTVVDYIGTDSWNSITNVAGQGLTGYWAGMNAHRVWSVPLIPSDGSSSLESAASGSYDSKYATVGKALVAGGDANATIRLGWEMTGDWFAWSGVKDPAAFAGAFRHAVTAMRSVPGQHFTFDFNYAMNQTDPTPMYPGDAYVDLIGVDNYDTSWTGNFPASDHVQTWNGILSERWGLNWLVNFASSHGKLMSMPEWGVSYRCDGHGGGDDPYFVDQVHSWVASHNVAYEAYFEQDDSSCNKFKLEGGQFPKAAAEYVKVSSAGPVTNNNPAPAPPAPAPGPDPAPAPAPVAPVGVPATTSTTGLLVSYHANRSSPVLLNKAKLAHAAYIYYVPASPISKVVFKLDGKGYRSETAAAYDLVGTTPAGAKPLKINKLKPGKHTIVAVVTSSSGAKHSEKAVFSVPAAKSLTTQLLRVGAGAKGSQTVRLHLAVLHGPKYLVFPTVLGERAAYYTLDGKLLRSGKVNARGAIHVSAIKLPTLAKGVHLLTLKLIGKGGKVTLVKARFRIT